MPAENIFQQYLKPPKSVMEYQAEYDQADARKNALQQSVQALQKGQMDLSNAADVNRQRNALRDAVTSGQLDLSDPTHAQRALAIAPDVAPALLKTVQEGKTGAAKAALDTAQAGEATGRTAADTYKLRIAKSDQAIKDISGFQNPQQALASLEQHATAGDIAPEQAQAIRQSLTTMNPADFPKWQLSMVQNIMSAKDRMEYMAPNANTVANNQTQIATNAATNATHIQTTGMTNATSRAINAANIGKDYRVAGLNPDGSDPNGTVGGLTPNAIDNAAKRYNFDGTLPPSIGRGTQGARDLRAIQNRAAELNAAPPDDASGGRAGQMANKADSAAFTQLTKQQQMASSFERTANANADLALGLSKKMDRTGIPLINAGIQAWRTGTGSPEATQFAAANETFVNEYAKIMSGGMGNGPVTDSARNKAHTLLTTSMTPQQYEGNVKLLQTEMQNRMKGYQDQADEIKARMHGGTKPAAATAPAATGSLPSASDIDAELARRAGKK
jgi:hypothetical protein